MIKNQDIAPYGVAAFEVLGQESLAVSTDAVPLASVPSSDTVIAVAISVGAQPVRVKVGADPTAADGFRLPANSVVPWELVSKGADLTSSNAERFDLRFIKATDATADSTVDILYLGKSGN